MALVDGSRETANDALPAGNGETTNSLLDSASLTIPSPSPEELAAVLNIDPSHLASTIRKISQEAPNGHNNPIHSEIANIEDDTACALRFCEYLFDALVARAAEDSLDNLDMLNELIQTTYQRLEELEALTQTPTDTEGDSPVEPTHAHEGTDTPQSNGRPEVVTRLVENPEKLAVPAIVMIGSTIGVVSLAPLASYESTPQQSTAHEAVVEGYTLVAPDAPIIIDGNSRPATETPYVTILGIQERPVEQEPDPAVQNEAAADEVAAQAGVVTADRQELALDIVEDALPQSTDATVLSVMPGGGFESSFQDNYGLSDEQAAELYDKFAERLAGLDGVYVKDGAVLIAAAGELSLDNNAADPHLGRDIAAAAQALVEPDNAGVADTTNTVDNVAATDDASTSVVNNHESPATAPEETGDDTTLSVTPVDTTTTADSHSSYATTDRADTDTVTTTTHSNGDLAIAGGAANGSSYSVVSTPHSTTTLQQQIAASEAMHAHAEHIQMHTQLLSPDAFIERADIVHLERVIRWMKERYDLSDAEVEEVRKRVGDETLLGIGQYGEDLDPKGIGGDRTNREAVVQTIRIIHVILDERENH